MDVLRKITAARSSLLLEEAFFGALALRLTPKESSRFKTMATDGKVMYYNARWVEQLSMSELMGTVCHEVMHVALGHPWREEDRDHKRWNRACDYVVNQTIFDAKMVLPTRALYDPAYRGMSAEQVYGLLDQASEDAKQKQQSQGGGSGGEDEDCGCGEIIPCEEDEVEELKAEWEVATFQAAQSAAAMGQLPGSLKKLIEKMREPTIDWKAILRRFLQMNATADYTWTRPNRRYLPSGFYLPDLRSERMPPLVIGWDTSGSTSSAQEAFGSEVREIIGEVRPESTHVVYCDAAVAKVEEFGPDEPVTFSPGGGGGTDFRPVFDWVAKEGIEPSSLIYFTDLIGRFPSYEPSYPVLWVSVNKRQAPFGETLYMSQE